MKKTVLCYLKNNDSFLMLYRNKKANDINEGKWIGVGGHIEQGENKEEALIREVKEETGLTLFSFKEHAEILFKENDFEEIMYLYTSDDFAGNIIECDEGILKWIPINKIKDLPMWEGDYLFLDKIINNSDSYYKMKLVYKNGHLVESEIIDAYNK
jgi:8-oxo-dGTP diphosphatase